MVRRPGGQLARRPLHFIWIADCSGSMKDNGKIQALNTAIREAIPHMQRVADENPNAEVLLRALKFSTGARWHISRPTPVADFHWTDLSSSGRTDLGQALAMVAEQLRMPPMSDRALPPVLVLISDGQPTDDFEGGLRSLMAQPWGKKAVRIAIAIGDDADHEVLQQFIGQAALQPLQANSPEALVRHIKWASTAVLQAASSPLSPGRGAEAAIANVPLPEPGGAGGENAAEDIWGTQVAKPAEKPAQPVTKEKPVPAAPPLSGPRPPAPGHRPTAPLCPYEYEVGTVDESGAIRERRPRQAESFAENLGGGITLEMVAIPGGTFLMGSPATEEGRLDVEGPQHEVDLEPFYLAKFPVTQVQWRTVAAWPQVARRLVPDPPHFTGDNRPVESIGWQDALEFCERLARKTGRSYRLPSEAEWEYACRAGTTTPFHFGATISPELANYDWEYPYGAVAPVKYLGETTPVGSFRVANTYGLFDMHGNVFEWCADPWHENYQGAPTDGSVWEMGGHESRRVLRGGSWGRAARGCRSASRVEIALRQDVWYAMCIYIGLRVACW